ncbi:MAG: hypothetical protein HRU20_11215 [Pseudomonadales bacterium]|nr:hypothetical protein [Pseudomonadales bacterium]
MQYMRKNRLGDLLLEEQLINVQQLSSALKKQKSQPHQCIGSILLKLKMINQKQLSHCLSLQKILRTAICSITYCLGSAAMAAEVPLTYEAFNSNYQTMASIHQPSISKHNVVVENHLNDGISDKLNGDLLARDEIIYSISTTQIVALFHNKKDNQYAVQLRKNHKYFVNVLNDGISLSLKYSY